MCVIERLAQVDFEPDKSCENCPVNEECIGLIIHIASKCVDLIHKLHEAAEEAKKGIREH